MFTKNKPIVYAQLTVYF